jgi:hypothetical protein
MLVDMDEAELWPQLRLAASRAAEVVAVYPRRDLVPSQMWLRLISSARHSVGVIADSEFLLADDSALLAALSARARSGVQVRVCLAGMNLDMSADENRQVNLKPDRWMVDGVRAAVEPAEFRVSRARGYNSVCYADKHFLVSQHVYGRSSEQTPVLRLHGTDSAELTASYQAGFEHIWSSAAHAY